MKYYTIKSYGESFRVFFIKGHYTDNDNLYIGLVTEDKDLLADVTVNIEQMCDPLWACIDTNNLGQEILDWLEKNGAGHRLEGRAIRSGYCSYPMFQFSQKFVDSIKEEE